MKKFLFIIIGILSCNYLIAQEPTQIGSGGTWATARTIINTNMTQVYDSLSSHNTKLYLRAPLASPTFTGTVTLPATWKIGAVTVTSNGTELNILDGALVTYQELNKLVGIGTDTIATRAYARSVGGGTGTGDMSYSDTATMLSSYARKASPTFSGVLKISTTDTIATQAYARQYGGSGIVTLANVRDEIADSLNVLRPAHKVGNGTVGPYFDGSADGGQILYFYGDNGFWTALQGGAPVANRSYRLPIAALPGAGTTSILNIDEFGNMGFVTFASFTMDADTSAMLTPYIARGDTSSMLNPYITDANARIAINDSLQAMLEAGETAVALVDSNVYNGGYATPTFVDDQIAAAGGGADSSIYVTVTRLTDSLDVMRGLINDLIAVIEALGVDATAPVVDSIDFGRFADDTLLLFMSEVMDVDSVPGISTFTLTEGATTFGLASVDISNDSIFIALDSTGVFGATYLLDYTRAFAYARDTAGNPLANFTNKAVTNNFADLGSEMVTNGALTSGTSWTATGGFTLTSNAATFDDVSDGDFHQLPGDMAINVSANTAYTVTFDVTGTSGGGIYMLISGTDNGDGIATYVAVAEYTNGSKTVNFTAPADVLGGGIRFRALTAGDSGGTIDNISLTLQ